MDLPYIKIYKDFLEIAEALDAGARGRLFLSILQYANGIEPTELTGAERIAYLMVKGQIDRDSARSDENSKSRSEAGKKGAAARWQSDGKNGKCHLPYGKNGLYKDKDKDKDKEDIEEDDERAMRNESLSECAKAYEDNIGTISRSVSEDIQYWLQKVDAGLVVRCIKEAATHNARSWAYIEKVLQNSVDKGVMTAEAFETAKAEKAKKEVDKIEFDPGTVL